jgi:class 3 adenylate cyclase
VIEPRTDDGERKQVTVLFADVSGSMDLAESQDPEEWRKIMQRFFSLLADSVTRFEGTVDKFTGDGIMAVFGAPIAHEDHAQRACYAALAMLEDVSEYAAELRRTNGLNFSTRIGINSGEVVAGAISPGAAGDYTAIGHTVGLAQRMEALAEPGRAYLTEDTAALAEGFLDLTDLGEFEIKGASRPVRVFELAGVGTARSRLDLSRARGFSSFVGRAEEMSTLRAALRTAEAGDGLAVGLVAEPGVGKSRLSHEFAQHCRESGLEVFEAQAQAHGQAVPYMPVLQMLRSFFGIGEREPEQLAREKIAGRALLLDPGFADDLPLLFDFLGVPDSERPLPQLNAEARRRALADVLCRLVNAPKRKKTLVLLVEDLHWVDEGSNQMLAELIGSIEGTRTLTVVNYRPEFAPPWAESPAFREIALEPLGRTDTRELLRDLAGSDPSLDGLDEPVHERTRGNPFFIEEIVRELGEAGYLEGERGAQRLVRPIDDAGVPPTVQAILAARIDRLDPEAKQLLQVASVVGKEIGAEALGRTAGIEAADMEEMLASLIGAGFLYEAELYPRRLLAFRHPLTREVAYGTQLAERRAATHAAAARATIELEPAERHDELAGLIAGHMDAGGETREAARWFARAADWAGHSQPRDALRLWRRVAELADDLPEDEESKGLVLASRLLQLEYAWRLGIDPEEIDEVAVEALEMAERWGDLDAQTLLKLLLSSRPGVAGHTDEWIASAEEAVTLADRSDNLDLRVAVRGAAAYAYMCAGNLDGLERTAGAMLDLCGDDHEVGAGIIVTCPKAWGLHAMATARRERGFREEAAALLDESLRLSVEADDPETESWSLGSKAATLAYDGETEAGLALALRNCEQTERLGDVFSRGVALSGLADTHLAAGEFEQALAAVDRAEEGYREARGAGRDTAGWRGGLRAGALLGVGRTAEALEVAEAACEDSRGRGFNWALPNVLRALALARAAAGLPGVAEALDEAEAVASARGQTMALERIEAERAALSVA